MTRWEHTVPVICLDSLGEPDIEDNCSKCSVTFAAVVDVITSINGKREYKSMITNKVSPESNCAKKSIEIYIQVPAGKSDITRGCCVGIIAFALHAKQFAVQ